ncbi:pantoate--beta-alanine ligase, partial [candidate division KSB1 bacterium]|nr:pantoate--beta-alanine ligase [candidate division KSB1 bacterium]
MDVEKKTERIRAIRDRDSAFLWGLVPTMGFLHEGHMSLVKRAREENNRVGVSIFVNPIQFNDPSDLLKYPRDIERDLAMLEKEKVDLVWIPDREEMYPADFQTYIEVKDLSRYLEGEKRPGHFTGVTTVVCKLFHVFEPTRAYFGSKDAQQLAIIRQMVRDLSFDIDIVACPTVREHDGLAMSSRNSLLTNAGRQRATILYQALSQARGMIEEGERDASKIKDAMHDIISTVEARIDYISIADM